MTESEYARIEGNSVVGEAILFMKSRAPNPDGTIGYIAKPNTPQWTAWQSYFVANDIHKQAGHMRARGEAGYMVPHANPSVFDPRYRQYRSAAE